MANTVSTRYMNNGAQNAIPKHLDQAHSLMLHMLGYQPNKANKTLFNLNISSTIIAVIAKKDTSLVATKLADLNKDFLSSSESIESICRNAQKDAQKLLLNYFIGAGNEGIRFIKANEEGRLWQSFLIKSLADRIAEEFLLTCEDVFQKKQPKWLSSDLESKILRNEISNALNVYRKASSCCNYGDIADGKVLISVESRIKQLSSELCPSEPIVESDVESIDTNASEVQSMDDNIPNDAMDVDTVESQNTVFDLSKP